MHKITGLCVYVLIRAKRQSNYREFYMTERDDDINKLLKEINLDEIKLNEKLLHTNVSKKNPDFDALDLVPPSLDDEDEGDNDEDESNSVQESG